MRLDFGVVHAREAGGPRERRLPGRTLLHLQRGARPLSAHQASGLEGLPSPGYDDRPSRRQGRYAPEDARAGRLYTNAACTQALLARPSRLYTAALGLGYAMRALAPERDRSRRPARRGPRSAPSVGRPRQVHRSASRRGRRSQPRGAGIDDERPARLDPDRQLEHPRARDAVSRFPT